jgi:hypothetical protein
MLHPPVLLTPLYLNLQHCTIQRDAVLGAPSLEAVLVRELTKAKGTSGQRLGQSLIAATKNCKTLVDSPGLVCACSCLPGSSQAFG